MLGALQGNWAMILLLMLVIGSAWAFFIALEMDRPDLIAFMPQDNQLYTHLGFGIILVLVVVYVSWFELTHDKLGIWKGAQMLVRNCVVLGLGVGLLTFISHELLHGIDPTGQRAIWDGSPKPAETQVNPPLPDTPRAPTPAAH